MQLFNIRLNGFHQNVHGVQRNKDYVVTFIYLLNILGKLAQSFCAPKLQLSADDIFAIGLTVLNIMRF